MKALIIGLALLTSACSSIPDGVYGKVGTGYKFNEMEFIIGGTDEFFDDKISARFEVGYECKSLPITFGYSHHSQWATGFPFSKAKEAEPFKDEIFIDYKFGGR